MLDGTSSLPAITAALEENMLAKFSYIPSRVAGMKVLCDDSCTLVDSGTSSDMFNVLCGWKVCDPAVIQEKEAVFGTDRGFAHWIGFMGEPSELRDNIGNNMDEMESELAMYCELREILGITQHSNFEIMKVSQETELQDFISILVSLLPHESSDISSYFLAAKDILLTETCPWSIWVGYLDGAPVSCCSGFAAGGVYGLWDIITLPDARRKGLGSSMTLTALQYASNKLGYKLAVLTATDSGVPLYKALHFATVKAFWVYNKGKAET
mmetsp:Transcript_7873/g.9761  ORF Transcript_7873/g.9761 Transcript_7873/m.9761 type:complete len:268 (-) Transcript_7873:22-825(-)